MSAGAPQRWNGLVASLHWLGALAILGLIALGFFMTRADLDAATKFDLYQRHKTLGWLTLALTLARLIVRALTRAPAPLASIPPRVRALAGAAHFALYALAVAVGLSGWVLVSASVIPIPIDLFGLASAPDIAPTDAALADAMAHAHSLAAYGLAALVALHFAAALKHHFIERDDTLRRMTWRPRSGASDRA